MATPIRPGLPQAPAQRPDAARAEAQRAFFRQAMAAQATGLSPLEQANQAQGV